MARDDNRIWQCANHAISLARPRIVGVLNVTPDSFSDGGAYPTPEDAIEAGLRMLDDGADIIEVGGESTRPGFAPVSVGDELARVTPVVEALAQTGAVVAIDTRNPEVARQCLELGAAIVNDVTGFTNPAMVDLVRDLSCGLVIMHPNEPVSMAARREVKLDTVPRAAVARATTAVPPTGAAAVSGSAGTSARDLERAMAADAEAEAAESSGGAQPAANVASLERTMAASAVHGVRRRRGTRGGRRFTLPESSSVMREVMGFLGDQARSLIRSGVNPKRIVVDPGAGFGKTAEEDVVIQRATEKMISMGYPLMCAVSRKRFVGAISGAEDVSDRDAATLGVLFAAIEGGATLLRVHDVAHTAQMLNAYWACSHRDERRAFVALGSNEGDRLEYLLSAREEIDDIPLTCVVASSHVYESEPAMGLTEPVLNAMVELRTELSPLVLLGELLAIEDRLGRERPEDGSHGPRTIDLDLVWYDGEEHGGRRLQLPHPGLGVRDFVIVPLDDLVPDGERFLRYNGIEVAPVSERIGRVTTDLGEL